MDGLLILNRQNTMVYLDENKSIIKTYFLEVSIETSQEQYELLIDLLNASKRELVISDYLKSHEDQKYIKRLLKVLYDIGAIFIYSNSYGLSSYFKNSWFRVLSQYLPTDKDILHSCRLLDEAVIHITPEVEQHFPILRDLLIENDMTVSQEIGGELKDSDWIITMENDFIHHNIIELSLSADKIIGSTNKLAQNYKPIENKEHLISKESLLYKVGPYYAMLYVIKSIVDISKSTFSLNKEGKFYEYDLEEEDFMQTVEEFSFPKPKRSKEKLDYIGNFESFINNNPTIPISISGWKDEQYADLFQMGYTTYSLSDRSMNDTFVYAGVDYIEIAMETIKKGLEYYFNRDLKQSKWMISTNESYYLDKVLFLLQYVDEPFTVQKVERVNYPNNNLNNYLTILNMDLDFYVKKYINSSSYIVYLLDHGKDKMYSDEKRTLNIEEKMVELALNYILIKFNTNKRITNILTSINSIDKEALLQKDNHEYISLDIPNEKEFIENGLQLFKHSNLYLLESAWKYEEQLHESNLIVRKIEVEKNQNSRV
ncbi:hypothetical protein [Ornithinibacillus sp. FSL M8-0202]|uniref:hypothetical protein n=1 Tax=Ornithinibacillus sp. FSL M8-0202 TaxID=2921616 RepID=UPI0030CC0393